MNHIQNTEFVDGARDYQIDDRKKKMVEAVL